MLNHILFLDTNNGSFGVSLGGSSTSNSFLVLLVLIKFPAHFKKMKILMLAITAYCYKYYIAAFTTMISNVNMSCFHNLQNNTSNIFHRDSSSGK